MSRTKAILVGILIFIVPMLITIGLMMMRPEPPKKPVENTAPLVEVIAPQFEKVTFEITAHGVVKPRTETTLVSEVSGVVQSLSEKFVAGGYFEKGEVLLQIDPTDYQVGVEQAKARLASQKAQYAQEKARAEQARKEWDLTGRSRENAPILALREPFLLEAKANMQSAEADLKKAEQKLARSTIRAPYTGMVKTKQVDIGQFVATGTQLGAIFAIDYAEVRLPLTDQELAFINEPQWGSDSVQQTSEVVLAADYAGQMIEWDAQLVRMEGVVDEQSRVHYGVARINDPYNVLTENNTPNHPAPLKIGTFVSAKIQGKTVDNIAKLPRDVFKNLTKVLVSDSNNQLFTRELNVIRSDANYVYVSSGLEDGDRVVSTAIESPVQGMALRIAGEEAIADEQSSDDSATENQNAEQSKEQHVKPSTKVAKNNA